MPAAPLSLTLGQFGIGTNIYEDLTARPKPVAGRGQDEMVHKVSLSTEQPYKALGNPAYTMTILCEIPTSDYYAFVADVVSATERRLSFLDMTGQEVYYLVRAGRIRSEEPLNYYADDAEFVRFEVSFTAANQQLYCAADDTVLLGA